jgi:DNA-directed RNA polymerase subunit RPC12/RpoP
MVKYRCSRCGADVTAPDDKAGKKATCPVCRVYGPVPAQASQAIPTIAVTCPDCGKAKPMPATVVGRKVRCPKCGRSFAAAATAAPPPSGTAPAADSPSPVDPSDTPPALEPPMKKSLPSRRVIGITLAVAAAVAIPGMLMFQVRPANILRGQSEFIHTPGPKYEFYINRNNIVYIEIREKNIFYPKDKPPHIIIYVQGGKPDIILDGDEAQAVLDSVR